MREILTNEARLHRLNLPRKTKRPPVAWILRLDPFETLKSRIAQRASYVNIAR